MRAHANNHHAQTHTLSQSVSQSGYTYKMANTCNNFCCQVIIDPKERQSEADLCPSCRHSMSIKTVEQASSLLWFKGRNARITGTSARDINNIMQYPHKDSDSQRKKKAAAMVRPVDSFGHMVHAVDRENASKAIAWGLRHEAVAINSYEKKTGYSVLRAGMCISQDGVFAASVDGVVEGFPGGKILEVKCPYRVKGSFNVDHAIGMNVYLEKVPGKVKGQYRLDRSTRQGDQYWHQVQLYMEVMKMKTCDLYVWTPNWQCLITIKHCSSYDEFVIPRLLRFYRCYVRHALANVCYQNQVHVEQEAKKGW